MSAALKLYQDDAKLSRKPPLGEKRPKLRLVWENPNLSHGVQKEKPEVKPEPSYGRVLYNYFRDYDPKLGRYTKRDPIGLLGGLNTYAYALGNPIGISDSMGLLPDEEESYCQYYEEVCRRNPDCNYYCDLAPLACRYVDKTPTYWGTTDGQVKCIRRCLVRRDSEERKDPDNLGNL